MKFEKARNTKIGIALATGLATLALTGCGGDENRIKPIRIPAEAIDLGDSTGNSPVERMTPGRSFSVPSEKADQVYCGGIVHRDDHLIGSGHSEPQSQDFAKRIDVIDDTTSQVDCLYDDWYTNYDYVIEHMTVEHIDSTKPSR